METSFYRRRIQRSATWRLIALVGAISFWAAVPAVTGAAGAIEVVPDQDLSVLLADPHGKGDIGVAVSNLSDAEATLSVAYVVPGKTEQEVASIVGLSPSQITVPAGGTTPVVLTFERKKGAGTMAGFVVVTGAGSTAAIPVTVATGLEPVSDLPLQLVVLALIVGVSLALVRAWAVPDIRRRWSLPIGNIGWNFSDSWATNLTTIGAILGTVASAGLLPDEPMLLGKEAYAGLNLFFGSLVVLAPFLFVATARLGLAEDKKSQQRDGYAKWFVISAALTLAAVIGELFTLAALLIDGFLRGTSALLIVIVGLVIAVGGFFVLVHAWRTIPWTIYTFTRIPPADAPPAERTADEVAQISLL